ncbi:MAG: hypothetical protein IPL26_06770 [Leptospiraceae bacterium]|nr:hypothetical protein [Leptospiraceae bacterium]
MKCLRYLSQFFFKDVKYYLQTGIHSIPFLPYPCTVLVNNVEERDVLLVGFLEKIFHLEAMLYFPIQKNLTEREFPFETKSIWKKIIKSIILQFSIVPIFIRLTGGQHLTKDIFNLLRTIRRNTSLSIYEKFESFKTQIAKRKTFVLFGSELGIGEGDLENISGILRIINKKNPEMNYIQVSLTYDYLLSEEGIIHISHGGIFQINPEKTISSIAANIKLKRSLSTTVTPGNLFAFAIYSPEVQGGVSRHYLFYKMERLANVIYREKLCNISLECLEISYDELFADILFNANKNEFIKYEKETKQYYGANKLYYYKKSKYIKQENIYRYHYMQLALFHRKFRKIWTDIEVYD